MEPLESGQPQGRPQVGQFILDVLALAYRAFAYRAFAYRAWPWPAVSAIVKLSLATLVKPVAQAHERRLK
jgi:hypothetical protein